MHLIEKLQNVLNPSLVKKIMLLDNPPNTIEGWVQKAITIDGQYRATMDVLNRRLNEGKTSKEGRTNKQTWSNYFDKKKARIERDPDAMDIDTMTMEKRMAMISISFCFSLESFIGKYIELFST
jgi:uncharacterized alpha/beta hydrolase family protein